MTKQERIALILLGVKHAENHLLEAETYAVYYDYTKNEISKLSQLISTINEISNELSKLKNSLEESYKKGGI